MGERMIFISARSDRPPASQRVDDNSDSGPESSTANDVGDSECPQQVEKGPYIQPMDVVSSYLLGSWFGIYGGATKDGVINEWVNIAIICGLSAGFAGSGFFAELPDGALEFPGIRRAFLTTQCFATLGMLTATACYLFLVIAGTECTSTAQFHAWTKLLGKFARVPLIIALASAVALYLGVCFYFIMKCGAQVATNCIVACMAVLFVPFLACSVATVWSVLKVRAHSAAVDHKLWRIDADVIYEMLQKYYEDTCDGSVFRLTRADFVHQFHRNGEVAEALAQKIYDTWLENKLASMIRTDPGF